MTEKTKQQNTKKDLIRRTFTGVVVSAKSDKTVVVAVTRRLRHRLYDKLYTRTRKFHVHDEKNEYKEGDVIEFVECRPYSKQKRWRVVTQSNKEA